MPSTVPDSSVPGVMLVLSVSMSTTLSRAKAFLRLTMSPTTPGWGMNAMSGVSLAWIFCMINWLMLLTFCHLTVMPLALASGMRTFSRPSWTGWSTLLQIVTDLSSLPLPPLPQPARAAVATRAVAATSETRPCLWIRIMFSSEILLLGHLDDSRRSVMDTTC